MRANRHTRRAGLAIARHTRDEWHPFERVDLFPEDYERARRTFGELVAGWRNNVYSALVCERAESPFGRVIHLAIRRHDGGEVHGWDVLQRIKAEVVGKERVALEVYPAESELLNQANMRHLFVLPAGEPAPFTIRGRWT